jgi:hypothetical protein
MKGAMGEVGQAQERPKDLVREETRGADFLGRERQLRDEKKQERLFRSIFFFFLITFRGVGELKLAPKKAEDGVVGGDANSGGITALEIVKDATDGRAGCRGGAVLYGEG